MTKFFEEAETFRYYNKKIEKKLKIVLDELWCKGIYPTTSVKK